MCMNQTAVSLNGRVTKTDNVHPSKTSSKAGERERVGLSRTRCSVVGWQSKKKGVQENTTSMVGNRVTDNSQRG